jgi:CHAT domain-containing protein/tetratricopeptide (TPR) repeat protein
MRTFAGTLRLLTTVAARGWLPVALCTLFIAGCSRGSAPLQLLATQCLPISAGQDGNVIIVSPDAGKLLVRIEERGVSVVAALAGDPDSDASSPLERFGAIAVVARTERGERHAIRIRTEDSPDIAGTTCYQAYLHSDPDSSRAVAEESLATAGRAVHKRDWETAFDAYVSAARGFDRLSLWRSSAATRQAMAELAYRRLYRKRESYALAAQALADYQKALSRQTEASRSLDKIYLGLLAGLQAKALIDAPGVDVHVNAPTIRKLLSAARMYDGESGVGTREIPRVDIMTGFLEYMLDEPARTHELFSRAAGRCRELRDWDCYAIANQNLALLAAENNNYAAALSAYADALRVLPPDLDPKLSADIWNNYGRVQGIVGLFSSSERSHARAMHEYARLGDCLGVRRSLSLSGNLMVQIGTLSDAEDYLQRAASRECPELLAGDYSPMLPGKSAIRGEPCAQPLDPNTLAIDNKMTVFNSLLSLGGALMLEGEPRLAQQCYNAAEHYAATARTQMRLANARGLMLIEGNEPGAARVAFEHSLKIADEADIPATYEYRGVAQLGIVRATLLAGKPAEAVVDGFQALQSSVGRGDIDQTVTSLRLLAAGLRGSQELAEAAHTLQAAANLTQAVPIDELDGEKRATYLATQYTVFEDLTDLYASQPGADMANLAFATSEEGRARSLRYAVNQTTRDAGPQLEAPAARYQQLLREVVNLTDASAQSPRATLVDHLDAAALRERGSEQPFDRAQLARTLQQLDAALVEYAVGDRDMFAFVINDDITHVVRLGDKHKIAGAAADLHDRLRDAEAPVEEVKAAAARLAKLILWPLGHTLDNKSARKRIVFVPDDALHTVPFTVLPWSSNPSDQLVLNHAEVSIAPSALFLTRLRAMNRTHANSPRIELIGDPVFRVSDWNHECNDIQETKPVVTQAVRAFSDWTESLPRLPGSRAEVQMIAQLARQSRPGSHVETFLGCAAVPSALRSATTDRVDLLHIATHARVDAQRPRLSALALTPERGGHLENSAFGLLDILGLKLNSSLVVLSACDTSRGRLLPGEGVLGPAQAFLQSGAAAVLASYWKVDDQLTSSFMQRFYRYLLLDHLPAAAALRRAQLDEAANSPSYGWAAFALYGWPDASL